MDVAQETGCAVLLVRHLNRSVGPNAALRGGGGIGTFGPRANGMLVSRHPDDPEVRVLAMSKACLGPPPASNWVFGCRRMIPVRRFSGVGG